MREYRVGVHYQEGTVLRVTQTVPNKQKKRLKKYWMIACKLSTQMSANPK